MENRIKEQFTDEILREITSRFGLDFSETKEIDAFENFVFISKKDSQKYILRISHTIRRLKEQVVSELEFLDYLHTNNLNVPKVFRSKENNLVEEVKGEGGNFLACIFEFIEGKVPVENLRTNELSYQMGKYLGTFHRLTTKYKPTVRHRQTFFEVTVPLFF